jgi:N-acetyl-gamma-glutamyl-phosphate reductase
VVSTPIAVTPVVVIGASGFSGMELCRLIAAHPSLTLVAAVADSWKGQRLGDRVEIDGAAADLVVRPQAEIDDAAGDATIVALATPAEVSIELAPRLLAAGRRVIDLSGAFRLQSASEVRRWYGFDHPRPDLLAEARYGLPQLPDTAGRDAPAAAEARLVANPGCYATAAILALAPLLAADLVEPRVFVDGKSGVTGAGRKVAERYQFTEVAENVSPYRVIDHQHVPEMELALQRAAGRSVQVTFAPHLLPLARGLIATTFGALRSGVSPDRVTTALADAYAGSAVVRTVAPEAATIAAVARTPRALVGARADQERGSFVSVCALDNLLKGAASQALENLLAMIGSD